MKDIVGPICVTIIILGLAGIFAAAMVLPDGQTKVQLAQTQVIQEAVKQGRSLEEIKQLKLLLDSK